MLLVMDVGNTNTVIGVYQDDLLLTIGASAPRKKPPSMRWAS